MDKKYFLILIFILVLTGVFADYDSGKFEIGETYAQGSYISGWINMSFEDESSGTLFTDNLGNSKTLKEVLEKGSYVYECDNNCKEFYTGSLPQSTKIIPLEKDEEIIIGFKFQGRIDEVNSIKFNISSNASESTNNQLEIDFFDDGIKDSGNTNASLTSGYADYSCFESSESSGEITIQTSPFCQRFELSNSPGFELGAWIKPSLAGETGIFMKLYDSYGTYASSCEINKASIPVSGGEVFCSIDYLVSDEEEYYVCINTNTTSGTYKTKGYSSSINCGFQGVPDSSSEEVVSYYIGVKEKNFGTIGNIQIDDEDLAELIEDYLWENYNGGDCQLSCYVPIKFTAKQAQTITLSNFELEYDAIGLPGKTETVFFNVVKGYPEITSGFLKISLNNLFEVGNNLGTKKYSLKFDREEILKKDIFIEDMEFYLKPTIAATNFPITFQISSPSINASKYEWDFGNGSTITTLNQKEYTFLYEGNYTINVTIIDKQNQRFTQFFNITVEPAEKMIATTLNSLTKNLGLLKIQLNSYESFEKQMIEKQINISNIESTITEIKSLQTKGGKEKEIIGLLLPLDVPFILKSSANPLPFFPNQNLIESSAIMEITQSGEEGQELGTSVSMWNQQNLDLKISKKEFSTIRDNNAEYLLKIFQLKVAQKNPIEEPYFLIIEDLQGLEFSGSMIFEEITGYKYILVDGDTTFTFSTTEDIEINELPLYFSPVIESLPVLDPEITELEDTRATILILVFIGLILIGFVTYLVLHRWYKIKYETFLFKDRNYLFNMITYVNNAKKQGLENDEIKKNLSKVGWTQEQIRYVMRKYSGKNTGMYEIPVKRIVKNKDNSENKRN